MPVTSNEAKLVNRQAHCIVFDWNTQQIESSLHTFVQTFREHTPGTGWWCPSTSDLSLPPGEQAHQLEKIFYSGRFCTGWNPTPELQSTEKQTNKTIYLPYVTSTVTHTIISYAQNNSYHWQICYKQTKATVLSAIGSRATNDIKVYS